MAGSRSIAKNERLEVRLPSAAKALIRQAAHARKQPVSDFMVEQSLIAAEMALADRNVFSLNEADWKAFNALLDAPSRDLPRLRQALAKPPVWSEDLHED
ncbi:MAG TPA: DUF1778 domain-containing protein [Beijerinckiaceae bacterium]|nr:DUF1778 domain-containing protein [Beijerinckiaceae bacterium]